MRDLTLFKADLTAKQLRQFERKGYITVTAKRGLLRRRYRILDKLAFPLQPLLFGFIPSIHYCVVTDGVPRYDQMLALKVGLEARPRKVLTYAVEYDILIFSILGWGYTIVMPWIIDVNPFLWAGSFIISSFYLVRSLPLGDWFI